MTLTFGLGGAPGVDAVRVTWPSGRVDTVGPQPANRTLAIEEGKGLLRATPIAIKR